MWRIDVSDNAKSACCRKSLFAQTALFLCLMLLVGYLLYLPITYSSVVERLANFSIGISYDQCIKVNGRETWRIESGDKMDLRGFAPLPEFPIGSFAAVYDFEWFCIIAFFDEEERIEAVFVAYT